MGPDQEKRNQLLNSLPKPDEKRIAVRVSNAALKKIRQGHPWVFESSITHQNKNGKPGDMAVIFDQKRQFVAAGLYDPTSPIRVRILQFNKPASVNEAWFEKRLREAKEFRKPLFSGKDKLVTNGYRLVYGENDGLPGLVIDRYADTLVLKIYTPAWVPYLNDFISLLKSIEPHYRLVVRFSRLLIKQPAFLFGLTDGAILFGEPLSGPVLFKENGITFEAEPIIGQKTGFFLDQRENRARVEALSAGKKVLNVFSYTGGFSVYAGRGGAAEVVSVDISKPAIMAAERNWNHNLGFDTVKNATHRGITEDAFLVLENMEKTGEKFDLVILDPPMFAHKQEQTSTALAAYRRLTKSGLSVLAKNGILVQASCSSRVGTTEFYENIHQVAKAEGRSLVELERSGHALDHPVKIPEGAYLKCLFARLKN